jgi:hypothetical protein
MEAVDPQFLGAIAVTSGVAFAMVWLGARLHMLETRSRAKRCPSCGLVVRRGDPCACRR